MNKLTDKEKKKIDRDLDQLNKTLDEAEKSGKELPMEQLLKMQEDALAILSKLILPKKEPEDGN